MASENQDKFINQFMNEKAGMSQIDKQSIAKKVEELTRGTPKWKHDQQMNKKRTLEVGFMLKQVLEYTHEQKNKIKKQWDLAKIKYEQSRDLSKYWAHFDYDMFYVACEILQRPQLKNKPCAVGGYNGVLCTANYEARKYGVRSAIPTFIANKLCHQLIILPTNFQKYKHYSNIFREILSQYDPNLQSMGLDEAYIQLTEYLQGRSQAQQSEFILEIRTKVYNATGLTVSCGVGANKMLAKLASQERKPNNQFILPNNATTIKQYMSSKPLRKIPGIGPVNEFYLKGLGIKTPQLILNNLDTITICFSKLSTDFFVQASLGLGDIYHSNKQKKSVGKSQTFQPNDNIDFLIDKLKQLCQNVEKQLLENGFHTLNIVLSYQTSNYQKKDKTFKLAKYTTQGRDFFHSTINYLKYSIRGKLRLLGIRATHLISSEQYKQKQLQSHFNRQKKCEKNPLLFEIKQLVDTELTQKGKYLCPVCNQFVQCKGNISIFNRHVDQCLMTQNSTNYIQQPQQQIQERTIRQQRLNSGSKNSEKTFKKQKKTKKKDNQSNRIMLSFIGKK